MRKKVAKRIVVDEEGISERERYENKVKIYLRTHRDTFLTEFAILCDKTNGRISYEELLVVLGDDYPKATWTEKNDIKQHIKNFFEEVGIPFRADASHLYFP